MCVCRHACDLNDIFYVMSFPPFVGWQQADTMSQASAGLCHPILQVSSISFFELCLLRAVSLNLRQTAGVF